MKSGYNSFSKRSQGTPNKKPVLRWVLAAALVYAGIHFWSSSTSKSIDSKPEEIIKPVIPKKRLDYRFQEGKRADGLYQWEVILPRDTLNIVQLKHLADSLNSPWYIWEEFLSLWKPQKKMVLRSVFRDSQNKKVLALGTKFEKKKYQYCFANNIWISLSGCQRGQLCLPSVSSIKGLKQDSTSQSYWMKSVAKGVVRLAIAGKVIQKDSLSSGWMVRLHHGLNIYSLYNGLGELVEGLQVGQKLDPKDAIGYFPTSNRVQFSLEKDGQWISIHSLLQSGSKPVSVCSAYW